jgi:hypothetical protein
LLESLSDEVFRARRGNAPVRPGLLRTKSCEPITFALKKGWLKLAQSYELRQRLTLFINGGARRENDLF